MTVTQIIDGLLIREGGYVDHRADKGGPTCYGITAVVLGEWRQLNRAAKREEVRGMSEGEARAIYRSRYIEGPGFLRITDGDLQALLVDIGVNSGPSSAVKMLQRVLGMIGSAVDGVLGERTLAALRSRPSSVIYYAVLRQRVELYLSLALDGPDVKSFLAAHPTSQLAFIKGWIRRSLEFLPA